MDYSERNFVLYFLLLLSFTISIRGLSVSDSECTGELSFLSTPSLAPSLTACSIGSEDTCYADCATRIWCFQGPNRHIDFSLLFKDVTIHVDFPANTAPCILTESDDTFLRKSTFDPSAKNVETRLRSRQSSGYSVQRQVASSLSFFSACSGRKCEVSFSPYKRSCLSLCGQHVHGEVNVSLKFSANPRFKYIFLFALGWLIFQAAPYLSEQIVFYYLSGVSLGVALSILLIAYYVLRRMTPKRSSAMNLLFAAIAQSLFGFLSIISGWWEQIITQHAEIVILYVMIAASFSLALTHWLLKGPRGIEVGAGLRDIVRVIIHLIGAMCIFMSSRSLLWSLVFMICLVIWAVLATPMFNLSELLYESLYPDYGIAPMEKNYLADHRFLSPSEYEVQGRIETDKKLKLLLRSEEFQRWAIRNSHRINVTSPGNHEEGES